MLRNGGMLIDVSMRPAARPRSAAGARAGACHARAVSGRCECRPGAARAVEGPAGIGKTTLLDAARTLPLNRGVGVLAARGTQLEWDFSYGVVRQLLDGNRRHGPIVALAYIALAKTSGGGAGHLTTSGSATSANRYCPGSTLWRPSVSPVTPPRHLCSRSTGARSATRRGSSPRSKKRWPQRPLYPEDEPQRRRALELEELFDEELGPHIRRAFYYELLPHPELLVPLFTDDPRSA